jgi:hypothetical protein
MLKYYIGLFLIAGITLFYIFLKDPCNQQLKTDFSNKYPNYEFLYSGAGEGSTDNVQCHVAYKKPDSEQIYEDTWLYQNLGNGWQFSRILEAQKKVQRP